MTVRQLLANIDSAELSEWVAYLHLERERDSKPAEAEPSVEDAWKKAFNCS